MPKQTISIKKFQEIAEKNLTKERIQELKQLSVMEPSSTIDLAILFPNEIELLILEQQNVIRKLQLKKSPITDTIAKNDENDENKGVVARLKRTAQRALQLLRLATGATISLFFIIPLVLIIVVPILVLSLTFAMVCLPIVLLSTPFIWFFASKNKTTKQKISDTLANETALLCTLQEASNNRNDRNEKVIGKENSNDDDIDALGSPIKIYPSLFNEKNSQLSNGIHDQPISSFISKSP